MHHVTRTVQSFLPSDFILPFPSLCCECCVSLWFFYDHSLWFFMVPAGRCVVVVALLLMDLESWYSLETEQRTFLSHDIHGHCIGSVSLAAVFHSLRAREKGFCVVRGRQSVDPRRAHHGPNGHTRSTRTSEEKKQESISFVHSVENF